MARLLTGREVRDALDWYRENFRPKGGYGDAHEIIRRCVEIAAVTKKIRAMKTVGEALKYLIVDVFDYSLLQLSIDLGLGDASVYRYVRGLRTPSFETTLAICLDLRLPPRVTKAVLEKTKRTLDPESEEDAAYIDLIDHFWACGDIGKINGVLTERGLKPLTPRKKVD